MNRKEIDVIEFLKGNLNLFKKKICWDKNCSNESMSLDIDIDFYNWLISKENQYSFIKDRYDEVILELLVNNYNKIWWFFCSKHEIGWTRKLTPNSFEDKKVANIFNKWQMKFTKVNSTYVMFVHIHFFVFKYKNKKFSIEEYFCDSENYLLNSEKIWLKDPAYFISIPISFKTDYEIIKYNGKGTSGQGKTNGPDFIFKNKNNVETIGFEIVEYQPLVFDSQKIRNFKKFTEERNKEILKKMDISSDEKMDIINEIIYEKNKKAHNYEPTDFLCLVIILNHRIEGYEYYLFEFWLALTWKSNLNNSIFFDIYLF